MTTLEGLKVDVDQFLSLVDEWTLTRPVSQEDCWLLFVVAAGVYLGFEFYRLSPDLFHGGTNRPDIPSTESQRRMVLDRFDLSCVFLNKLCTVLFTYHSMQYAWHDLLWDKFSLIMSFVHLITFFVLYDLFYWAFHRSLHIDSIYPLLHKHHHQQHAPFRGNIDAINTHPIEYFIGQYDHLFVVYLVHEFISPVHWVSLLLFILIGGYFASLNHTRHNFVLGSQYIYSVAAHDTHHRIDVKANYGQYTIMWDCIFGTFKGANYPTGSELKAE
eukprot:TRINITY_DN7858_c4_g1_i1.p1 TRINITY_DN7858_c4_g1~~TRINITY_DN7858_c4_g1_i1.p1  ORF type:complete len:272 (+),score=16.57 TRINITY_DN7858_c4_g1_i1:51-866(+)